MVLDGIQALAHTRQVLYYRATSPTPVQFLPEEQTDCPGQEQCMFGDGLKAPGPQRPLQFRYVHS